MYYPIGWHKALKLDTLKCDANETESRILQVQANHERELLFILTTRSIHIWFPKPCAEIVCHRRSDDSIESIGLNKSAIWKTDSSVIVVVTECDQLLFYQVKKRTSSTTATSFLIPNLLDGGESVYKLKHDPKNNKKMLDGHLPPDTSDTELIPALTIHSFGKLDLSSIGVSCLMAAEEEFVIGSRNGDMYGINWDGNVDDKFPWSLSKEVQDRRDYLLDLKFSSVLSGFAFVFNSGQVGFMPLRMGNENESDDYFTGDTSISYLPLVKDAICVEINHKYRLIAYGLRSSKVVVCNIDESDSIPVVNHILELDASKIPHDPTTLGPIKAMSYSPDNAALAVSWHGGDISIWSVFGSLLYCSLQWRSDCDNSRLLRSSKIHSLAWGREGYNLWMCSRKEISLKGPPDDHASEKLKNAHSNKTSDSRALNGVPKHKVIVPTQSNSLETANYDQPTNQDQILIMSLAHSNLSSSPHFSCSSDSIVLLSEDKIYVGPSIPQGDKFDHWIIINVPQDYLRSQQPIRFATVDRGCKRLAIAGVKGLAFYSIETSRWQLLPKKECLSFSVCGDLMWWHDYIIVACFVYETRSFEIRAYGLESVETSATISETFRQPIMNEIVRMSIFESRLLALYVDGTLGMFMLNLRRRPTNWQVKKPIHMLVVKSNSINKSNIQTSISSSSSSNNNNDSFVSKDAKSIMQDILHSNSLDSNASSKPPITNSTRSKNFIIHIAPIENLIISNLQANSTCISSIALTRLHFRNNRQDDSILLNACGKLFLLEREIPHQHQNHADSSLFSPTLASSSVSNSGSIASNTNTPDYPPDLSIDSQMSSSQISTTDDAATLASVSAISKVSSPRALANSVHLASASLKTRSSPNETSALSNITFKSVSVIATNVEQFWISPEISSASGMSYFRRSLWLLCGNSYPNLLNLNSPSKQKNSSSNEHHHQRYLQVWLPLLNDENDQPNDLFVPDRIMLPVKCDIYPLAIRSSSLMASTLASALPFSTPSTPMSTMSPASFDPTAATTTTRQLVPPDDAIVLGAESDVLYKECKLFTRFPYTTVKRQCRVYLHRILRELLLNQHLGYYAKKIAESCQSLPYFAHCFELLLHEVLEEESTSPVPLPDPMLPQVIKFIRQFPQVYLETVVHCARKSELTMWSHLFDEQAVGHPRRLFQECIEKQKLDTAASCLIILQSFDKNIVSLRMIKELIRLVEMDDKFTHLLEDLKSFSLRAELERNMNDSSPIPTSNR